MSAASAISEAALRYGWRFILCGRRGTPEAKNPWTPEGRHVYADLEGARRHFARGFNIGLVGHNLTILDWDSEPVREVLFAGLGALPLTVQTGSGKFHTYLAADATLPATIWSPDGTAAGQVRRLPTEYVVTAPSVHPNGQPYRCLVERIELAPLPANWRAYLVAAQPRHDHGAGFEIPEAISEGERHRTFFRWTRSWKAQGFTLAETLDILRLANKNITRPPLRDSDLERFVERCYRQPDRAEFVREVEL